MKSLFIISISIFFSLTTFAQKLIYNLKVVDNRQKPLQNITVFVKENSSKQKIFKKTDSFGNVVFELDTGNIWIVNIGEQYNYKILQIPENVISTVNELTTYDLSEWKREHTPPPDRNFYDFKIIDNKNISENSKLSQSETLIILKISDNKSKPLNNCYIALVNFSDTVIYKSVTDIAGKAKFIVPNNKKFFVDISNFENFTDISTNSQSGKMTVSFTFQPDNITENIKNDTITQNLQNLSNGTTARILYKIHVQNKKGENVANEEIFLKTVKSKYVYKAVTDSEGNASFMLPKKKKYLIDFEFAKDVDVIDLSEAFSAGIGSGNMNITYIPKPELMYPEQFIPSAEELLINEFNNFITKQFPHTQTDKPFKLFIKWGSNIVNKNSEEAILEIGLSAVNDKNSAYGPPLNISFVMDKSGSMAGYERIEQLKFSLSEFVKSLRPDDIASLIIFDSQPEILFLPGYMSQRKDSLLSIINSIEPGGFTNIYDALILGYEQVQKNFSDKALNRVILLTDGHDPTEPKIITDKSKEYNLKGIQLSAIGVGYDYNQALLTLLSNAGGGNFQHVNNSYNLQKSFDNELASLMFPVAKDVLIEIIYNEKIMFSQLYGFPTKVNGQNSAVFSADNIFPGYTKLAIAKFQLINADKNIEKMPVTVKLSYFDYKTSQNLQSEEKMFLKWEDSDKKIELVHEAYEKKLYAIAVMNQSLKVMSDAFSQDNFIKAENAVNDAIRQINELYPEADDKDVDELYKKLKNYSSILKQYKLNKYKKSKLEN